MGCRGFVSEAVIWEFGYDIAGDWIHCGEDVSAGRFFGGNVCSTCVVGLGLGVSGDIALVFIAGLFRKPGMAAQTREGYSAGEDFLSKEKEEEEKTIRKAA